MEGNPSCWLAVQPSDKCTVGKGRNSQIGWSWFSWQNAVLKGSYKRRAISHISQCSVQTPLSCVVGWCFLIVSVWLSPTREAGFGAELEESHTEVCRAATQQPCPLPGVWSCAVLGQTAAKQQLGMGVLYQSHRESRAAGSTHCACHIRKTAQVIQHRYTPRSG